MTTIGDRIKFERERAGMTQNDLSAALRAKGATANRVSISKWENNVFKPNAYPLKCMAEIFGVTMDYLMDGLQKSNGDIIPDERELIEMVRLRPIIARVISGCFKLSDDQIIRACKIIASAFDIEVNNIA